MFMEFFPFVYERKYFRFVSKSFTEYPNSFYTLKTQ